ncbi:Metaxin-2 [Tieghemiomyces parasiticus]|uniref:Metaxin-2 n=1 Tax=Tieghemiomyces parasiticus TaxID=78921 RepID=A0A9W8ABQ6_9FUNG|nr:Metaxin-2 [Tieghemiomyces parasiticus]
MATPVSPLRNLMAQLSFTSFPLKVFPVDDLPAARLRDNRILTFFSYGPGFTDDAASFDPECLRWLTYLKAVGLPFRTEFCNEPLQAPNGRLPFLVAPRTDLPAGPAQVVADEDILDYLQTTHGAENLPDVAEALRPAQRALLTLVQTVVADAARYYLWVVPANYEAQTRWAYGARYVWPVNWLEPRTRQQQITRRLLATNGAPVTRDEMYGRALEVLRGLMDHLGETDAYFFGAERPTLLDVTVFAHLFPVLSAPMPESQFRSQLKQIPRLENYVRRIWDAYYQAV